MENEIKFLRKQIYASFLIKFYFSTSRERSSSNINKNQFTSSEARKFTFCDHKSQFSFHNAIFSFLTYDKNYYNFSWTSVQTFLNDFYFQLPYNLYWLYCWSHFSRFFFFFCCFKYFLQQHVRRSFFILLNL